MRNEVLLFHNLPLKPMDVTLATVCHKHRESPPAVLIAGRVVSTGGKRRNEAGQVTDRKRPARNPLTMCRRPRSDIETTAVWRLGMFV
jgi:hypothetical protein